MAVVISKLAVLLSANTARFQKGMTQAENRTQRMSKRVNKLSSTLTIAAGAAFALATRQALRYAGAMKQAFMRTLDLIDQQTKMARQLGLSQEAMAGLTLQAGRAGVQNRKLQLGLQRMTRRIAEAAQGLGEAQGALNTLGLDARELARLSPDRQFARIAEAMAQVRNRGEQVRLSFKLFDSEGVELLRLLDDGQAGIDASVQRARDLGLALSKLETRSVEVLKDTFQDTRDILQGIANTLTVKIAPFVTGFLKRVNRDLQDINTLVQVIFENELFTRKIPLLDANRQLNELLGSVPKLPDSTSQTVPVEDASVGKTLNELVSIVDRIAGAVELMPAPLFTVANDFVLLGRYGGMRGTP